MSSNESAWAADVAVRTRREIVEDREAMFQCLRGGDVYGARFNWAGMMFSELQLQTAIDIMSNLGSVEGKV